MIVVCQAVFGIVERYIYLVSEGPAEAVHGGCVDSQVLRVVCTVLCPLLKGELIFG